MDDPKEALDETVFNRPEYAQFFGGINENTVLSYFAESQFFDETSNNAALLTQAAYNQSMAYIRESRQAFEGALRGMQGVEFVLANESPIPEGNDVWIIRKQQRRKVPRSEDLVTVLATYYVVGESIYMAPSVGNVLQSKLLSMTNTVNHLFDSASILPLFNPALGHRYIMPTPKPSKATASTNLSSSQASGTTKDGLSQGDLATQATTLTTTTAITTTSTSTSSTINPPDDPRLVTNSFTTFLHHRNTYMDENPLRGEPGNFILTSSKEHLAQQAALKAQAAKLLSAEPKSLFSSRSPLSGTPKPSQSQSNSHSQSDSATQSDLSIRKGAKSVDGAAEARPKAKRRKSKMGPATPG